MYFSIFLLLLLLQLLSLLKPNTVSYLAADRRAVPGRVFAEQSNDEMPARP